MTLQPPTRTPVLPQVDWNALAAQTSTPVKPPQPHKGGLGGLVANTGRIFKSLPSGLYHSAGQLARDPVALGIVAGSVAAAPFTGGASLAGIAGAGLGGAAAGYGIARATGHTGTEIPFSRQFAASNVRTAKDIAHPQRFAQAYRQGELVSKVLEDAANASLVAGVAAKPLTVGLSRATASEMAARGALADTLPGAARAAELGLPERAALEAAPSAAETAAAQNLRRAMAHTEAVRASPLTRAGVGLQRAAALGGETANLPISIPRAGARRLGEIIGPRLPEGVRQIGAGLGRSLSGLGADRQSRQFMSEITEPARVQAISMIDPMGDRFRQLAAHMSPVEQEAAGLLHSGEFPTEGHLQKLEAALRLPEDRRQAALTELSGGEFATHRNVVITPDAARLLASVMRGTAEPEVAGRVATLARAMDEQVQARQQVTPLPPEQAKPAPMASEVERHPLMQSESARLEAAGQQQLTEAVAPVAPEQPFTPMERSKGPAQTPGVSTQLTDEYPHLWQPGSPTLPSPAQRFGGPGEPGSPSLTPREARVQAGLTQAALTRALRAMHLPTVSVSQRQIQRIESGAATAPPALLAAIERVTNRRPGDLTGRRTAAQEWERVAPPPPEQGRLLPEEPAANQPQLEPAPPTEAPPNVPHERPIITPQQGRLFPQETPGTAIDERVPTTGPMSPAEQFAPDRPTPLPGYGEQTLAQAGARPVRQLAEDALSSAPDRFRPAIQSAEILDRHLQSAVKDIGFDAGTALGVDIADTTRKLVEAGVNPVGGIAGLRTGATRPSAFSKSTGATIPRRARLATETPQQDLTRPRTAAQFVGNEANEIRRIVNNQANERFQSKFTVRGGDIFPDVTDPRVLEERMAAQHMVPWQPAGGGPVTIGPNTLFAPEGLVSEYGKHFGPSGGFERFLQQFYDPVQSAWKMAVLPLSGTWHVGNVVGNTVMASVGTGGLQWLRYLPQSIHELRQLRKTGERGEIPMEALGPAHDVETQRWIGGDAPRGRNPVSKFIKKSYAFNAFIDDATRGSVFLLEKQRRLAAGDTAAITHAAQEALKIGGDFGRLSPFEQQVMRRVFPFYTWMRHVTQLVWHLGVDHPARIAWTMHLGNMFANPEDVNQPYTGGVHAGGGLLSLGNLNPLSQFSELFTEGDFFGGVTRATSPIIKLAAAATTGADLSRGGAQLTRPPGTGALDAFGRAKATPLLTRPGELLGYAAGQTPLTADLRSLIQGPVARYGTGAPVVSGPKLIHTGRQLPGSTSTPARLGIIANRLGIPTTTNPDLAEIERVAQERAALAAKQRASYQKRLKNAR